MKISYLSTCVLMSISFLILFLFNSNRLQSVIKPIELNAISVTENYNEKSLPGSYGGGSGGEGRCLEVLCRGNPCNHCTSNGECCYDKCSATSGCEETVLWCAPGGNFCDYP